MRQLTGDGKVLVIHGVAAEGDVGSAIN